MMLIVAETNLVVSLVEVAVTVTVLPLGTVFRGQVTDWSGAARCTLAWKALTKTTTLAVLNFNSSNISNEPVCHALLQDMAR